MSRFDRFKEYAMPVCRLGVSAVFLWFGINQLLNPSNFIGYLPQFLFDSSFAKTFVLANGTVEIILGGLMALGFFTRIAALILGVHLLGIMATLGYGAVAVRDFGLSMATFAVAIGGDDILCLPNILRRRRSR